MQKIKSGSVKDVYKLENNEIGFVFSDRFSVFDWGEMPDSIDQKGTSLAQMAIYFFDQLQSPNFWNNVEKKYGDNFSREENVQIEILKEVGQKHHCLGPIKNNQDEIIGIKIQMLEILTPLLQIGLDGTESYNYHQYVNRPTNTMIPLEVIFRFGVPEGSSFLKRMNDKNYLREIGVEGDVETNSLLERPIIEFSTKLEKEDKILSYNEAQKIAGMNHIEFDQLKNRCSCLAFGLKYIFEKLDIKLWDGKFEFGFGSFLSNGTRDIILIDSIGPDELRLKYDGVSLSKQCLRNFYLNSPWHKRVEYAKDKANKEGKKDWKAIYWKEFSEGPDHLNNKLRDSVSQMYKVLNDCLQDCSLDVEASMNTLSKMEKISQLMAKN